MMYLLLDIDGVMVTTPSWKPLEFESDGFLKFDDLAIESLAAVISKFDVTVVLTSSHRHNASIAEWQAIFLRRGLYIPSLELIDSYPTSNVRSRAEEIEIWVSKRNITNYVIIDDDKSLNGLLAHIKERLVLTEFHSGFNNAALTELLTIKNKILKMSYDEIIEKIEGEMSLSEFFHEDEHEVEGIGKIETVDEHGGNEGGGEECWKVFHVPDHDVYIRINAAYFSGYGVDLDGGWSIVSEVRPVERMVTFYE